MHLKCAYGISEGIFAKFFEIQRVFFFSLRKNQIIFNGSQSVSKNMPAYFRWVQPVLEYLGTVLEAVRIAAWLLVAGTLTGSQSRM